MRSAALAVLSLLVVDIHAQAATKEAPVAAAPPAEKKPMVHPDTLPSIIEEWALDAAGQTAGSEPETHRFTIEGDTVYLHDNNTAQLIALDANSGRVKWFAPLPKGKPSVFSFRPFVYEGRRVIVAGNKSLYYVNAETGQVIWRAPLPGAGTGTGYRIGDLLVFTTVAPGGAATRGGPAVDIYALNLKNGKFAWHKRFGGSQARLLADDAQAYLLLPNGDLMAIARDSGEPVWRVKLDGRPGDPILEGNQVIVPVRSAGARVMAFDTTAGKEAWQLKVDGATRVALLPTKDAVLAIGDNGLVIGIDPQGKEKWRVQTLVDQQLRDIAAAADDRRAYIHTTYETGGALFSLIDLAKGKLVATANGLAAGAATAAVVGKVMVVDTGVGVLRAFRLDRSDKPRRKVVKASEWAKELAATAENMKTPAEIRALADKIASLGPTASPELIPLLASQSPNVVAVATLALDQLGERKAAGALLLAFERERKRRPPTLEPFDMAQLLAHAIGRVGDTKAVAVLDEATNDKDLSVAGRRAAFVAMGQIATPNALAAIARFKAPFLSGSTKWSPIPRSPALEFPVGSDVDWDQWPEEVRQRTSITATDSAGKKIVVSLSPFLGGYNDIWLWRTEDGTTWTKALFTGLTHPSRAPLQQIELVKLDIRAGGLVLTYKLPQKGAQKTVHLNMTQLEKDQDGDGLTDLIEKRLGTKADDKDSDGDGLADAEDLNPNAPSSNQPNEDQLLYREVFFAYEAFFRSRGIVVVDRGTEARLEYFGRRDPIITLRRRAMAKLQEDAGLGAIDYVGFAGPYPEGSTRGEAAAEVQYNEKRDEAMVGLDVYRGGKNGVGYNVKLRKIGGQWIVADMAEKWHL